MKSRIFILGLIFLSLNLCKPGSSPESPKELSLPIITSFIANPENIKRGSTSILSWNVMNSTSVTIDQGVGSVSASGSKSVKPLEDTVYTLKATNSDGSSTRECSITVENGADVVMISGPKWKEDNWTFSYFGIAKNKGTFKASYVKVYIYLYDKSRNLVDYDYTYVDKTHLKPNEQSPWEESWWDSDKKIRNKIDKSKTEYEFEWSEYTWIVKSGRRSIYDR